MPLRLARTRSPLLAKLEMLEPRDMPSAALPVSYIYTETDNSTPGQNAVVAFAQSFTGQLRPTTLYGKMRNHGITKDDAWGQ